MIYFLQRRYRYTGYIKTVVVHKVAEIIRKYVCSSLELDVRRTKPKGVMEIFQDFIGFSCLVYLIIPRKIPW